ncbi:ABC transporter ATP-binding protein [Roseovarius spongiae]|uniref:ABC transporter ATP-binding protein n=1 Tax=Roseovarius spongiae TaxID=2320272 RepID=A0A3A8AW45_9RHOB|nr:ABC transporter ATP-binding protein [Roseovarius spongiae]RKF15307.1 ABC transporter ATP-binding protein [Roseovarius spongiae]
MLLEVRDMHLHYGKVEAVKGVSLELREGQIITLIGANGAGKSSILRAISGLQRPSSGEIRYRDKRVDRVAPDKIVDMGIVHVPEGRRLFKLMTVRENLRMGAYLNKDGSEIAEGMEKVFDLFPILREKQNQQSGRLSGGQQQMVAMGRALMARPKVLLLDEPSLGLAPKLIDEIADLIVQMRDSGLSIVLVEQNANLALTLSDHGYVMETGSIALHGPSKDLLADPEVARAYLGA